MLRDSPPIHDEQEGQSARGEDPPGPSASGQNRNGESELAPIRAARVWRTFSSYNAKNLAADRKDRRPIFILQAIANQLQCRRP
jgi:hypothetical protein